MAPCEVEVLAWRFVSGDLDSAAEAEFARHLNSCAWCREVTRAHLAWADRAIFDLATESPPDRVWKALEDKLRPRRGRALAARFRWVAAAVLVLAVSVGSLAMPHFVRAPLAQGGPLRIELAANRPVRGRMQLWGNGHFVLDVSRLPRLPEHQLYELWTVSAAGDQPLGALQVQGSQGRYAGTLKIGGGVELVLCREPRAWVGHWMGTVVMSARIPSWMKNPTLF
ncbi:MAG: anti-sigma factor [Firmicutes bacterium]|nr:anti-sigma factor [Bacillota bacterium]